MNRRVTREVRIGSVVIGGSSPIAVQSMTKTDTRDSGATLDQIRQLEDAGCDIVRVAVPDIQAAEALVQIKKGSHIPVIADIHFDYRLALVSLKNGADKIRINPGNIGGLEKLRAVALEAKERGIPIRIGVNSGSLEKTICEKYGGAVPEAMVESAMGQIVRLYDIGFENIVVAVKSSNVPTMIEAYRQLAVKTDVPLHLGVTEAGTLFSGTVKSCVGIGTLLAEGVGDTIRVSLTGDPVEEVRAGREILKALNLNKGNSGFELISCPGCGRCKIDVSGIAVAVEDLLKIIKPVRDIKIAVMGCVVNGPGEAGNADIGIAGGDGCAVLFKKGEIIHRIPESEVVQTLINEIKVLSEK